ncbi:MAG: ribonuclease P protein component [Campylobacterota bacterium]|nr:ribonuclease P protein component [Campylobacterota bacterium]
MSCLSKSHRINTHKEFNYIYRSNKKWHTHSFVVFFQKNAALKVAFVSSKKVGNAVSRNRSRRLLKSLVLSNENNIQTGMYIFVAKNDILNRDYKVITKDFNYALKKLGLLVN